VSIWKRGRLVPLGTEVALAFLAGVASFGLVAVAVASTGSDVLVILMGVAYVAAVVAMFRWWGVAYAVPAAMAGLLAFDWYYLPPTHPHEFPDSANLADLLVYLAVAVLIGELAAHAGRRADVSEVARSELLEEQRALRRVATLVARGVSPDELFAAVAEEVGLLLEVDGARVVYYEGDDEVRQLAGWSAPGYDEPPRGRVKLEATSVTSEVLRTGRAARIDDYESVNRVVPRVVQRAGIQSGVGAPIFVDARLWGAVLAWSMHRQPLPETSEARLAAFTELVATAISNTTSQAELARLADEQTALRRVATLVARGVPPFEVFSAVARELGQLLGVDATHMGRYEPDGTVSGVASWSRAGDHLPVGTQVVVEGENVTALVLRTGRPARMDSYDEAAGPIATTMRELGLESSVGAPIVVDGRLWGVMIVSSRGEEPLAPDTESRIRAFTELVATAISNTEARAEVGRLADEQAALRRVATLVARESSPAQVFAAVAKEVGQLLRVEDTKMFRYEADGSATVVADWGERGTTVPIGTSLAVGGENVASLVLRTERPARVDDSAVGTPIVVEGRLWGAMIASSTRGEPLPAGTESRIEKFTELVATAISNMQARSDLAASRARIVAATDDERRRVVRDLHDGAQQRLVHTVVTLKLARDALEQEEEDAAPALVDEALDHAQRATDELRELAHGIIPAVLTHGGLRAGVEALASRMPVPVDVGVSVDRLPAPVEATAYFVVAEALTNVAKHSAAERAEVAVLVENGTLRVHVCDDGVGGAQPDGSGLVGLGDRLAALDGRLRVESPAGGGTRVEAAIPLSR
jgi:signal transduction histidine kinase